MSRGPYDPRLFFSIDNIQAFHIQDGNESELTPSGPQTLSLLMVPTSYPPTDPELASQPPEEDFYLHLHLPPELDLPLPATTQIYHQPPNSYLIPRWDLGPNAGAFTRIQFPQIGSGPGQVSQEDVDTFETILAQCTAFLERSPPPKFAPYNPATYAPGEGYVGTGNEKPPSKQPSKPPPKHQPGQIVLIDEENGSVVGELTEGFNVVEDADVKHGSKNPVEIQLPTEGQGNNISVHNVSDEYLQTARHPAYAKSTIVQTSATASRLLVAGSAYIAKSLQSGANTFTQKTKPNAKPLTFTPTTQARMRRINTFSGNAAGLSSKTVSKVTRIAQNFGASVAGKKSSDSTPRGFDENGQPIYHHSKPGILNKSLIAFSTIADGIDQSAKHILQSGPLAATTIVGHRYGPEAGKFTAELAGGVKNVGLVYIDAAGVSRKAVLKSVAKGMVVGRMKDGQQIVVGGGDSGPFSSGTPGQGPPPFTRSSSSPGFSGLTPGNRYHPRGPSPSPTPPPAYGSQTGRSLGGSTLRNGK
ncbi:hypothetical protein RJZ56_002688 [Blastomyces dermatitidis]|uniref:Senescence domain-containing protein n=1 Tax=Blastomyces gilchristii (strain SLH14081) TaxID=559298 RepID=A0A179UYI1_BLAGS|nr:uncharacterized protein BDBG_08413 [Blastomyces gilchristii SLH14081]XP_031580734.1 hypothetical protein, variant [Blastomyces gilchristii SLH14081]EQL37911.1 hypothetical protein BDFG_00938 [Blastomyces dermatitidis ATCC 26199]EQL37912.1 hypothetical protein, variant [Blastomyces dermatitidis ATCC 26199]OAT13154.1 hypothetical protein BDBG_08413 [Blastomyces gilchristii SLH14081]OAT13155.1 hypothetical protein, variant [Blastomyces gilchristii SLH14081]